ncbi:MAG TPA: hypothetical protein VH280_18525 [Verrucomicrobiae bacterium]|jgi:hypothetical protein|nr:hypothetical protein [Verrucomicrobiae bacterium]
MKTTTWTTLAAAIGTMANAPDWLKELARLTHAEISQLPKLDDVEEGHFSAPAAEEKTVANDYLDFLREQIKLNARGPKWTAILQGRLNALQPFIGKKVLMANLYRRPDSASLYINPETGQLFHVEVN